MTASEHPSSVMKELLERLAATTEGSIELDREIEAYLYPIHRRLIFRDRWNSPPYTRSVESALTLVPDGVWWNISQFGGTTGSGRDYYMAEVFKGGHKDDPRLGEKTWGHGTPAIALCIAALKARDALARSREG